MSSYWAARSGTRTLGVIRPSHCRFRRVSFDHQVRTSGRPNSLQEEQMFRIALLAGTMLLAAPVAAAQLTSHRVRVNGMEMYYEVSGSGEPLIVLHGAYMNILMMGEIVPQLATTHRVYALELQGHGRTTDINRPITYQHLADDVAAFMDAVGLTKADLFGYSMGAIAGLQFAIRHPAKITRLVAASGAYDLRGWQPEFQAAIPQMSVDMLPPVLEQEYRKLAANPNGFRELARKVIARSSASRWRGRPT